MAYPIIDAPYGVKPVNLIGVQVFSGSTRNLPIAYNYATPIYYGDLVTLGTAGSNAGFITVTNVSTSLVLKNTVGVFLGCYYTNPTTKQRQYAQYYPGNVLAGDITAIVADDPDQLFKVAVTGGSTSSTITPISGAILGSNMGISQPASNTTISGNSNIGAYNAADSTVFTLPLRVIGLVPETTDSSGNYSEVIVKWNMPYITLAAGTPNVVSYNGGHSYLNPNGQFNV